MIAPLATLAFLAAVLLLVRLCADMLERSGSRILDALRGAPSAPAASVLVQAATRRPEIANRRPIHALPQLRAAA